jgi:ketosteroid isomerase-like protein
MKAWLLLPLLSLSVIRAEAQIPQIPPAPKDELFRTIASLDAEVFDAYNRCDLEKFGSFFTEELEFYHDNGGPTNLTRQGLVESVKNNICGKAYRILVPGTLEVYTLKGYGAIEIGVHRFYHPGRDSTESVGEAKFLHIWQQKDGKWQITRVLSYDHHPLPK